MILAYLSLFLLLASCSAGNTASGDPTERGLSYVAGAIISAAVIRAFFNK